MRYLIQIKTIGGKVIIFRVKNYTISKGFVCFIDEKTGLHKKFHSSNSEIEEILYD